MNRFCKHCGSKLNEDSKFCPSCGQAVPSGAQEAAPVASDTQVSNAVTDTSKVIVKCGNCGYIGEGKPARRMVSKILAWSVVWFAPLVTALYFVGTHKYQCPKCGSTFLGIKNKDGVFAGQRGGASRVVIAIFVVLLGVAITGILASIVLVSLNSAREKAREATRRQTDNWQTYNSVENNFSVLFPAYPTVDSKSDSTSGGNNYTYNTWKATKGVASFYVINYVYKDAMDVSNPKALLESLLNGFVNGTNGKLVSSNYKKQGSYPALEFQIDAGTESMKGLMVLVGQVPYVVAEDYYPSDYVDADYQRFINSFVAK